MRERIIILAVCASVVIGGLGIAAWVLLAGEIQEEGIDGLFLLSACLLLAGAFSLPLRKALPPGLVQRLSSTLLSKARRGPKVAEAETNAEDKLRQASSDPG